MTAQLSLNFYPHAPAPGKRDTSRAACPSVSEARTLQNLCLSMFEKYGPLTADEVAWHLRESVLAIRPRITELSKLRAIEKTELRRKNHSNHSAIVWRLKGGV